MLSKGLAVIKFHRPKASQRRLHYDHVSMQSEPAHTLDAQIIPSVLHIVNNIQYNISPVIGGSNYQPYWHKLEDYNDCLSLPLVCPTKHYYCHANQRQDGMSGTL